MMVNLEDEMPLAPSWHSKADAQARHSDCGGGRALNDASGPGPLEMPLQTSTAEALLKLGPAPPPWQISLADSMTHTDPFPAALWQQLDQRQGRQTSRQHTADDACHGLPAQLGPSLSPGTRAKRMRTLASIYAACDMTTSPPEAEACLGAGHNRWQRL